MKQKVKEYYIENREKIIAKSIQYNKDNSEKRKQTSKRYYEKNKDTIIQKCIIYNRKNIDKSKKSTNLWRDKNKEKIITYGKEYRKNNKEKVKIRFKNWAAKNKESLKIYNNTPIRKAARKNMKHIRRTIEQKGDVTSQQIMKLQLDSKVCYWCEISLKNMASHIDHYVPLSRGGLHTIGNLVISCAKCNLQKNAKDPLEFANSLGRLL